MEGRPLRDEPRFGGDYQKYRQAYKAWHERERTRRSKLLTLPALAPERPTVSASADGAMPWRTHENEKVTVNDDAETVVSLDGRQRSRLPDLRSVTFQLPPDDQRRATASAAVPAVPAVPAVEEHQCSGCPPAHAAPPVPRAELVRARESIFVVPGVECLGCLLGHRTLKPVQDAIRSNAAYMDEAGVLASALRAYEQIRAKCRAEGVEAPGWTTAGIRTHFWEHALDPVLEAVRMVRQLDAVQCLLMETLQGGGETPASTLRLLDQVSQALAKQHAWLETVSRACLSEPASASAAPAAPSALPAGGYCAWEQTRRARGHAHKRGRSAGSTLLAPSENAHKRHPSAGSTVVTGEDRRPASSASAGPPAHHHASYAESPRAAAVRAAIAAPPKAAAPAPMATAAVAAMDASLARQVLGEFLASYARPCTPAPAKAFKVQRTLKEAFGGAAASNVLQRSRRGTLRAALLESCCCRIPHAA